MREAINIIYHSVLGSICSYQIKNEAAGCESSVHWSRHEFIYACNPVWTTQQSIIKLQKSFYILE